VQNLISLSLQIRIFIYYHFFRIPDPNCEQKLPKFPQKSESEKSRMQNTQKFKSGVKIIYDPRFGSIIRSESSQKSRTISENFVKTRTISQDFYKEINGTTVNNTILGNSNSSACTSSENSYKSTMNNQNSSTIFGQIANQKRSKQVFVSPPNINTQNDNQINPMILALNSQPQNNAKTNPEPEIMPLSTRALYRSTDFSNENQQKLVSPKNFMQTVVPKNSLQNVTPSGLPPRDPGIKVIPKGKLILKESAKISTNKEKKRNLSEETIKKIRESSRDLTNSFAEKKRIWVGKKGKFSEERLNNWYAGMRDIK